MKLKFFTKKWIQLIAIVQRDVSNASLVLCLFTPDGKQQKTSGWMIVCKTNCLTVSPPALLGPAKYLKI